MFQFVVIALLGVVGAVTATAPARILLHKSTVTDPVVEGQDFVITYTAINNGGAAATKLDISDRFDVKSFDIKGEHEEDGSVSFTIDEIASGSQESVNVTIVPKLYGMYESTRARLRYFSADEDLAEGMEPTEENQYQGYSSSLGRVRILSTEEYARVSALIPREWLVFGALFVVSTVIPLITWLNTKAKNQALCKKKRN